MIDKLLLPFDLLSDYEGRDFADRPKDEAMMESLSRG
jgi:hypothetical protein